jgi:phospholipid/cholesterol/gamma-HCH transport system substrate-binding protein
MQQKKTNLVKLGIFILSGLLFLVVSLYLIGRNQQLFRASILVKTHFRHAGGVVPGNNVRYAGIQAGTVKSVTLINDTTIEFKLLIDKEASKHILKNSLASIGTEGLIGNKVVNLIPGEGAAEPIQEGDEIATKKTIDTDVMLETLAVTNRNAALLSAGLVETISRFNNSTAVWKLLEDSSLAISIKTSLANIEQSSVSTRQLTSELNQVIHDLKQQEGLVHQLIYDTTMSGQLERTLAQLELTSQQTVRMTQKVNELISGVQQEIKEGKGPANAILSDTSMTGSLHRSLTNIEKSTAAFNENMTALQHNFLFRGYFRKKEKKARTGQSD